MRGYLAVLLGAVAAMAISSCAGRNDSNPATTRGPTASQATPATASPSPPAAPIIRLVEPQPDSPRAAFVVDFTWCESAAQVAAAWDHAQWSEVFMVQAVPDGSAITSSDLPALAGSYSTADQGLRFEPSFPLEPGMRYRARFDPSRLPASGAEPASAGEPVVAEFAIPRRTLERTTLVSAVFPSSDVLPENQLKFYIHFSAPMSRGEAYQRVRLLDASGSEVKHPFLELDEELWDPSGTRFTLLLDPGRIKRGLRPREEVGPVFEEGRSYSLVVDAAWHDAAGSPLREGFRKEFDVAAPDDAQPDPADWTVRPPTAATRDDLELLFPEPLDHAMLHRVLAVIDSGDTVLAGSIHVDRDERRWRFTPRDPWQPGKHHLIVQTDLEDRAGNSIARVFDVDLLEPISRTLQAETVRVPFQVGRGE